jgi:hypothetical protein
MVEKSKELLQLLLSMKHKSWKYVVILVEASFCLSRDSESVWLAPGERKSDLKRLSKINVQGDLEFSWLLRDELSPERAEIYCWLFHISNINGDLGKFLCRGRSWQSNVGYRGRQCSASCDKIRWKRFSRELHPSYSSSHLFTGFDTSRLFGSSRCQKALNRTISRNPRRTRLRNSTYFERFQSGYVGIGLEDWMMILRRYIQLLWEESLISGFVRAHFLAVSRNYKGGGTSPSCLRGGNRF